jgi:hypothetical protein
MKNIEETEQMAKAMQAHHGGLQHHQSGTAYQRFQIDNRVPTNMLLHGMPLEHALPTGTGVNDHNKRPLRSTDDLVADRFKKVSTIYIYIRVIVKLTFIRTLSYFYRECTIERRIRCFSS